MSERWGPCIQCGGAGRYRYRDAVLLVDKVIDCGRCGTTGESGAIEHYYDRQPVKRSAKEEAEYQERARAAKEAAARTVIRRRSES